MKKSIKFIKGFCDVYFEVSGLSKMNSFTNDRFILLISGKLSGRVDTKYNNNDLVLHYYNL